MAGDAAGKVKKQKKSGKSGRYKPGAKRNRKETRVSGQAAGDMAARIAELEVVLGRGGGGGAVGAQKWS